MSTVSSAHRAVLVDAVVKPKPFYGEGIWSFPRDQFNLFLVKEPFRISLCQDGASSDDIEKLVAACAPATFGLNQTDVLDESYRKASKLDRADFAINLDIFGSGLLDAVRHALFGWEDKPRDIRAELYKLNVYGPGSFFKAHKDTPRGEDMFGSLVLNFPTKHKGGALVLRHDGHEITLDASRAEYASPDQVSWAAFYSDVEHEVLPVQSGQRVTLTYNLYFKPTSTSPTTSAASIDPILSAFKTVLSDKTFMSNGGVLGFGLAHQYPIPSDDQGKKGFLGSLTGLLKGNDSALFHAAQAAKLRPKLKVAYDFEYEGSYLLDRIIDSEGQVESWEDVMGWYKGTKIAAGTDDDDEDWRSDSEEQNVKAIEWIVPRNRNARVKGYYIAYGNEASLDTVYGDIVLTVTVPIADERS